MNDALSRSVPSGASSGSDQETGEAATAGFFLDRYCTVAYPTGSMRIRHSLAAVILPAFFVACAPATRIVVKPASAAPRPSNEVATVLIGSRLSKSAEGWHTILNLLDESGKVQGQLYGRSRIVLQRPAGPFTLYAVSQKTGEWGDKIAGTLEAGRVYYVTIGASWNRRVSMTVLSSRTDPEAWKDRKTWETDIELVEADGSQLAGLQQDLGDTKALLAAIDGAAKDLDANQKKDRMIEPSDGEAPAQP